MDLGKVWLVGAGPSDAELMTVKGKRVIEEADVIVYDALVGKGILSMIPTDVELINVGKRAGNHIMVQEDINKVLLDKALEGKKVVRLKGGDPFLFGIGGEELELLIENNIEFEIVPGITSAISVPAYNGIPVTHRDFCSSLHIITGHKKKGEKYNIDFEALVRTKGTLVFLMGIAALGDICSGLLEAGIEKDMPAAVLCQGTTARQRKVVATISTLVDEVERQGVTPPGIIVVGKVCSVSEKFEWYSKKPLFGKRIVVTRPKDRTSVMSQKLRLKGAEVLEIPAIRTEAIDDNKELKAAVENIDKYDWLVFTSPAGVKVFFDNLKEFKIDIRKLGNVKIASIGSGTTKEIEKIGLFVDLMPEVFDGENLGKALADACKDGEKILIPRAELGTEALIDEINKKRKVTIDDIATYKTIYEKQQIIDQKEEFMQGNIDYVVFTSASTVKAFNEVVEGLDMSLVTAICIGKQTKAEADKLGMKTYMAKKATIDSVVECVIDVAKGC